MKKTITAIAAIGLLGAGLFGAAPWISDIFDKPIDTNTDEGKKTIQDLITGTWVHTDTLCKGEVDYETIKEYRIGVDLPSTTIGAVRLESDRIDYSTLSDENLLAVTNAWFEKCQRYAPTKHTPIIVEANNYSRARTFLFYPEHELILMVKEDGIYNLVKDNVLFELPIYIDPSRRATEQARTE
jgi:hypothetical protein